MEHPDSCSAVPIACTDCFNQTQQKSNYKKSRFVNAGAMMRLKHLHLSWALEQSFDCKLFSPATLSIALYAT